MTPSALILQRRSLGVLAPTAGHACRCQREEEGDATVSIGHQDSNGSASTGRLPGYARVPVEP
jgi:hypothetical protein